MSGVKLWNRRTTLNVARKRDKVKRSSVIFQPEGCLFYLVSLFLWWLLHTTSDQLPHMPGSYLIGQCGFKISKEDFSKLR